MVSKSRFGRFVSSGGSCRFSLTSLRVGSRVSGYSLCLEPIVFSQCRRVLHNTSVPCLQTMKVVSIVTVHLVREQQAITISSLYAPVDFTRRLAFFARHLPVLASSGCFVFGDFNTVLSPTVYRRGDAPCACADGVPGISAALAAGDFVDVYRRFFLFTPGVTWRKRDGTYSSRIDLVLVLSFDFSSIHLSTLFLSPVRSFYRACMCG